VISEEQPAGIGESGARAVQPAAFSWTHAVWTVVTLRVCFEIVGLLGVRLQPITVIGGDWLNLVTPGNDVPHQALSLWQRWDALWYQQIALHGYTAGNGTATFFPLYPLLSRLVTPVMANQAVLGELLISSVALGVGLPLLYRLARLDMSWQPALLSLALLLSFPVAFFLSAPYTESLYLACSVGAFWLARTGRPWAAGLAGFAAALTRIQGALLTLPLCFLYLQQRSESEKGAPWQVVSGALPGLGAILVVLYLRRVVGEWQTGLAAQARWGYETVSPWHALGASWQYITSTGDPVELLNLVCLIGFTALAVWVTFRLPLAYSLYIWPYLAILFFREMYLSPLMSVSRYVLVLFPCFFVVAPALSRRLPLAAGLVVVMWSVQLILFVAWEHFTFVA
jgi:hypothetical protein